jgi:TP901 family phage tail tape measure protein
MTATAGLKLLIDLDEKGASTKVDRLSSSFTRFKRAMSSASKNISEGYNKISSSVNTLIGPLKHLGTVASLSFAAFATAAAVTGARFEQSMADTAAAAQLTSEQMRELSVTARGLAQGTVYSAKEIADAMNEMARQGSKFEELKNNISRVILFAGASGKSISDTVSIIDNTMSAFGVSIEKTGEMVELLLGAMNVVPIQYLTDALVSAAPIAADFGLRLEDVIGIMSLMESRGMTATRAARALNTMLMTIANPTTKELADALGGVVFTGDNLTEVMNRLRKSGLSAAQVMGIFKNSGVVVNALLETSEEKWNDLFKQMNNTATAQEAYERRMETTAGKMKMLKNAIQEELIATFEALKPAITAAIETIRDAMEKARPYIVGAAKAFGDYLKQNEDFIPKAGEVIMKILGIAIAFSIIQKAIVSLGAIFGIFKGVFMMFGIRSAPQMVKGLGVVGLALSALTVQMLVFKATFQKWGNDIIKLWVAMFVDIASEVQFWVGLCLGIFEKFLSVLPAPIAKAFGWVQEKAEGFFSWGVDAIKDAVGKAKEHFDSLKTTMSSVFDIRKEIADALAMLKELGSGMTVGPMTISAQAKAEKPESFEEEMLKEQRALIDSLHQDKLKRWEDEVKIRANAFKKERDAGMAAAMETEAYMNQADRRWAEARIELARYAYEEQLAKGKGTVAELAAAQIEYDRTVAEAELAWQDAVWEDYKNKHQEQMMLIRGLEAAWDTMVDTALDKEMTGKQRREEMWQSMKRSFLQTTSEMMKAWLANHIRSLLLAEASEKGINIRRKFQEAKIGAVKAYQAFAGIPIIGPILGAAAAAAAFGFLMAFV